MIDWQRIDNVLFDMDGTLLDLHFDNHFWLEHLPQRYAEKHGVDPVHARAELALRFAAKRGQLDWYCVDYWTRELDIDIEALKHETADRIALRPGTLRLLDWLGAHGKRRFLVTNAHRKSLAIKLARTGIGVHFEQIVSSHDFGHAKEHDAFWHVFSRKHHLHLDRCLFIDDSLDVLRAAQRNGVGAVLAIPNPDSQQDARDTGEFAALADLTALIPSASSFAADRSGT